MGVRRLTIVVLLGGVLPLAAYGRAHAEIEIDPWGDAIATPGRWWNHTVAIATPGPTVGLALGATTASLAHGLWDDDVAEYTLEQGEQLPTGLSDALEVAGHPGTHLTAAALLYGTSLFAEDTALHQISLDLGDALMMNATITFALKQAFDTTRPNGDPRGFPSGHTSSSFAAATVLAHHYGWTTGTISYALAAAVALQRIDARKHDVSDVAFGISSGIAIGLAVTSNSTTSESLRWVPFVDPIEGHHGLALEWRW